MITKKLGKALIFACLFTIVVLSAHAMLKAGVEAEVKEWKITCKRIATNAPLRFKRTARPRWYTTTNGGKITLANRRNKAREDYMVDESRSRIAHFKHNYVTQGYRMTEQIQLIIYGDSLEGRLEKVGTKGDKVIWAWYDVTGKLVEDK